MTIAQKLIGTGINPFAALQIAGTLDSTEAGAGTTQAGATLLSLHAIHWVKTGASNSGVVLPPGTNATASVLSAGDAMMVFNNTGNTLKVYPPGTGAINGGTASAAVSLTDKQVGLFTCLDGGTNANFCSLIV